MIVLGINNAYHESSAAILVDGKLVAALEEERLNRVKHAKSVSIDNTATLPFGAIDTCLRIAGLTIEDVDAVGFSFAPKSRYEQNASHEHAYDIRDGGYGSESGERRLRDLGLLVPRLLAAGYGTEIEAKCTFLPHHLCHAASAYYPAPYDKAAVIAIDGIGEFESTTVCSGEGSKLTPLYNVGYPNSMGFLWERITEFIGFRPMHDECKVMGLAAYGKPERYREAFSKLISTGDGTFKISDEILKLRSDDMSALEELFGPRRLPHEEVLSGSEDRRHADIASALQAATDEVFLELARTAKEKTGASVLCLAGGVALNCVSNAKIALTGMFDDIWIQPAANDAGTALGAAAILHARASGDHTLEVESHAYLGPGYTDEEIETALETFRIKYRRFSDVKEIARLISEGKIVGWFDGRLEFGPRALGHRSILGDPRKLENRNTVNAKIKRRELFRPLCPSVLEEEVADWFEVGERPMTASRYMLMAYPVKESMADRIPAVLHEDRTSRVQAVRREDEPRYYDLIKAFQNITGVPMILNTSFNSQEPMVCSPHDAIRTFLRTGIDLLVLGPFVVDRQDIVKGVWTGDVRRAGREGTS